MGTSFVLFSFRHWARLASGSGSASTLRSRPRFSHVAFYAAKEKGYFQEEGLDVEVILMSGAIGIRALIAGDVDAIRLADPRCRRSFAALPCEWFFQFG